MHFLKLVVCYPVVRQVRVLRYRPPIQEQQIDISKAMLVLLCIKSCLSTDEESMLWCHCNALGFLVLVVG